MTSTINNNSSYALLLNDCGYLCAVIELSFITPNMSVKEDAGSISVCFMGNTSSARTYTVVLMHQPTGSNPATCK